MRIPLITSLVFPGASVAVPAERLAGSVRPGEQLRQVSTGRGEPVAVIHRPPAGPGGRYTLFLYGNAMTMADTAPIRAVLAENGAGVVCVDYVGYGGSPGEPTETGCYRAGHAALDLIEHELGAGPGQVDVVGWSLGSAVALRLASSRPAHRLVLLSPFAGVAPFVLAPVRLNRSPLRRLGPFAGAARAPRVSAPTLLISGADDALTPTWMAEDLRAGLGGPATLEVIPRTGHNDLFTRPEVWASILRFLG